MIIQDGIDFSKIFLFLVLLIDLIFYLYIYIKSRRKTPLFLLFLLFIFLGSTVYFIKDYYDQYIFEILYHVLALLIPSIIATAMAIKANIRMKKVMDGGVRVTRN